MRKIFSKTAFTLIELIVSTVLVAIVLLGIFAVNNVLSTNNQDYGQKFLVKSETQSALNNILSNVSLASGSGTNLNTPVGLIVDKAILMPADGLANNSFCMHQNNGGDIWLCYMFDPVQLQVTYCTRAYNLADPAGLRGANGACLANTTQFLGTAKNVVPTYTNAGGQLLFSITITNCLNNALLSCTAGGVSGDPANNPEIQVTGSAFPTQSGM